MNVRDALKCATRDVHDRLDAELSSYRLDNFDDYRTFLLAQAAAFLPVERALSEAGAAQFVPNWSATLRSPLLFEDLALLGAGNIHQVPPPVYASDEEVLGGIYVLEGSRMGAAVLARVVPTNFPRRFLSTRPPPGHWAGIIATLERKLCSSVGLDKAKAAAQRTFACFELATGTNRGL